MSSKVHFKDLITVFSTHEKPAEQKHDKNRLKFKYFNTSLQLSKIKRSNGHCDFSLRNASNELEQKEASKKKRVKTSHCVQQKEPPYSEHVLTFSATHKSRVLNGQEQTKIKLGTKPNPKAKQEVKEVKEKEDYSLEQTLDLNEQPKERERQ